MRQGRSGPPSLVVAGAGRAVPSTSGLPATSKPSGDPRRRDPEDEHRREERPALPLITHKPPEGIGERKGNGEERPHLEQVREAVRVLERMRRVRVVRAAAVRSELLDRLLARDRPTGDRSASCLRRVVASVNPRRFWTTPWLASTNATTSASGSRMRVVERVRSTQKFPIVSERRRVKPRMSATATAIPRPPRRSSGRRAPTSA